jgi:hypothetical protein
MRGLWTYSIDDAVCFANTVNRRRAALALANIAVESSQYFAGLVSFHGRKFVPFIIRLREK